MMGKAQSGTLTNVPFSSMAALRKSPLLSSPWIGGWCLDSFLHCYILFPYNVKYHVFPFHRRPHHRFSTYLFFNIILICNICLSRLVVFNCDIMKTFILFQSALTAVLAVAIPAEPENDRLTRRAIFQKRGWSLTFADDFTGTTFMGADLNWVVDTGS